MKTKVTGLISPSYLHDKKQCQASENVKSSELGRRLVKRQKTKYTLDESYMTENWC